MSNVTVWIMMMSGSVDVEIILTKTMTKTTTTRRWFLRMWTHERVHETES